MSNLIWKTDNLQEADIKKQILFCAGGSSLPYLGWHYPNKGFGTWGYEDVQKWAYLTDIIAQADKAERLEKENEAMREEFEVWHGNHKCVLEDNERLQKAVGLAVALAEETIEDIEYEGMCSDEYQKRLSEIKQLIKRETDEDI